jgi:hypothetical protein
MAKQYRKKPVVVEAVRYRKNRIADTLDFVPQSVIRYLANDNEYYIETLEGNMMLTEGDYIIKGVNGEFYPCKPDIFEKSYDEVGESA